MLRNKMFVVFSKKLKLQNEIYKKISLLFLLFFLSTQIYATVTLQAKISLNLENASLEQAFEKIKEASGLGILYQSNEVKNNKRVSASFHDASLDNVLSSVLEGTGLDYTLKNDVIVVKKEEAQTTAKPQNPQQQRPVPITFKGKVMDEEGEALTGVSIRLKSNAATGTTSDINGNFTLIIPENEIVVFTYLGMETKEVKAKAVNNAEQVIRLKSSAQELGQVIVIGTVERNRESFTGATKTVSGEDLKSIGSQNLVQSLKTLDPSFVVMDNILDGSNPNVLPKIEVRGVTSIAPSQLGNQYAADPNQPLFILDGFETSLRVITDLDMNRVASVTILKDAASTAMYGSKSANGVILIETIKPVAGKFKVTYNGDYSFDIPDLTSYNMMNAEEKLQFELLSGRYTYGVGTRIGTDINSYPAAVKQMELDATYNARLAEIRRGVNSYWLSDPVQTAFSNRQSVRVSGGSNELILEAGLLYRNNPGVMKGSGRQNWGGNIDLSYRKAKFNIINRLNIYGSNSQESPYGDYSIFVNTNPYYRKTDNAGTYTRYLERDITNSYTDAYDVANPLYNAMLFQENTTQQLGVENNLQAIWDMGANFRLRGGLNVKKEVTQQHSFTPPENTKFDDVDRFKRGKYSEQNINYFSYNGNISLAYTRLFNQKHSINANIGSEIQETNYYANSFEAVGYPYGTNGNPSFSFSYPEDSRPEYASTVFRRVNFLSSANYSYDLRYLFDVTYKIDGSTVFGSAERYSPFWSAGIGWNIHKENFMRGQKIFNLLKLRGNVGTTGNQNLGEVVSTSTYRYQKGFNDFGTGLVMETLGNEHLKWSTTTATSIGLDINLLNNRLTTVFDIYRKYTDPVVVAVDQPSSSGVKSYFMNLGYLQSDGFDFSLNFQIINNPKIPITWGINAFGSIQNIEYGGFGNKLEGMNAAQKESKSITRYRDGSSPKQIWAVPSLGIDPASGRELFLKTNGEYTFIHDTKDEVVIGDELPDILGVVGTYFTYKQVTLRCNLRYSIGGDILNRALYDKVENISFQEIAYNQDRRALYDRWQKPGDIARFKSISITEETPISSRFVQTENYLSGESLGLMWQLDSKGWIRTFKMSNLRLSVNLNNFFRLSNVKSERGISYPFSRSLSFSINASF